MWIDRPLLEAHVRRALDRSPVVVLLGPRQVGKSTLSRVVVPDAARRFDLEDPRDLARLADPILALEQHDGPVVIDEAQLRPDLFPALRVLVDADRRPGRFLVLGSASPDLVGFAAESLAGRVTTIEMSGFTVAEVGVEHLDRLWLRGGFPESFLAADDARSADWRGDFITSFVRRDLADLGVNVPAAAMYRFWSMLAHYHGQVWNGAELARSLDVSQPTVRRYVDALTDALVVRQLQPWYENLSKRQVKSPRVFIRDTGLLHSLLGLVDRDQLDRHPRLGASWEGFVIEHLASRSDVGDVAFWSTHSGAEIDLRLEIGGHVVGIEVKHTSSPKATRSMRSAVESLRLDHLYVVYRGDHRFPITDEITAVPAATVLASPTAAEWLAR